MKTNFLFFLNAYNDLLQTTAPALSNFRWSREINGVPYNIENSQQIQVLSGITSPNIIPYPFSSIMASPNAALNSTVDITISGSTTGIAIGQLIVGTGIPVGAMVVNIVSSVVTMSQAATTTSGSVALSFYNPATFIYMESDQAVSMIYNNGSPMALNPFQVNGKIIPGVFFMNGPVYSLTVTNPSVSTANIFLASMG